MFTVPVARGSRMKLRPVCWPTVLITDWMSAFTKLTVILSSPLEAAICEGFAAGVAGAAGGWASAPNAKSTSAPAATRAGRRFARALRNGVTYLVFGFDLSGHFAPKRAVCHSCVGRNPAARAERSASVSGSLPTQGRPLGLNRVRELQRLAAPLDLGVDHRGGGELLVETRQVAGRGDGLAVDLLDDVARLQAQLLREASAGGGFHSHAAAGRHSDDAEIGELVRVAERLVQLLAREGEAAGRRSRHVHSESRGPRAARIAAGRRDASRGFEIDALAHGVARHDDVVRLHLEELQARRDLALDEHRDVAAAPGGKDRRGDGSPVGGDHALQAQPRGRRDGRRRWR